jgi:hypothetical protein
MFYPTLIDTSALGPLSPTPLTPVIWILAVLPLGTPVVVGGLFNVWFFGF